MPRPRILVVGDERPGSELFAALSARGFDASPAPRLDAVTGLVERLAPDAVVATVERDEDGAELVQALRAGGSDAAVVAVATAGRLDAAVAALRAGADTFVVAPLAPAQAALVVEKALDSRRLRRDSASLREQERMRHAIVGASPELQLAHEIIRRAAPTKATVLITGEPGTGHEIFAHAAHEASPRRGAPFVHASCAGVSETLLERELFGHAHGELCDEGCPPQGLFERASGGTVFLDEVAQLTHSTQVKLLRVLQQGELERVGGGGTIRVDVRIIAGSTRDLAEEVRAGRLRDDLYYRLNVVAVTLPPLRARKGDVPALVEHFLALSSRAHGKDVRGASPGVLSALFAYDWPGNVRELETVVDRAVAACDGREIALEHLTPVLQGSRTESSSASALIPGATLFEIEREAILRTLEEVGGSTARAAEVLGVSVRKIQYRLKEYKTGNLGRRRAPERGLARVVQG